MDGKTDILIKERIEDNGNVQFIFVVGCMFYCALLGAATACNTRIAIRQTLHFVNNYEICKFCILSLCILMFSFCLVSSLAVGTVCR